VYRGDVLSLVSNGKAITMQPITGPEGSRRFRFLYFETIGTWRW